VIDDRTSTTAMRRDGFLRRGAIAGAGVAGAGMGLGRRDRAGGPGGRSP
jgi:hypothetical protein